MTTANPARMPLLPAVQNWESISERDEEIGAQFLLQPTDFEFNSSILSNDLGEESGLALQDSNKNLKRCLYVAGAVGGFLAQVPFYKVAKEASNYEMFSNLLGVVYVATWWVLYSWMNAKIVQTELSPSLENRDVTCCKTSLKIAKIVILWILGAASVAPDAWFAYQYHNSMVFPLFTLSCASWMPTYSLVLAVNNLGRNWKRSKEHKRVEKLRDALAKKISLIKNNLEANSGELRQWKAILAPKQFSGSINSVELASTNQNQTQEIVRKVLYDDVCKPTCQKVCGIAGGFFGLLSGLSFLGLIYLGAHKLMRHEFKLSRGWSIAISTVDTLVVAYLSLLDTPKACSQLAEQAYTFCTEGKVKTAGAKINPLMNGIFTASSVVLASLSWGSLCTLAGQYFDMKIHGWNILPAMRVILPLGFCAMVLRSLIDVIDDGLLLNYDRRASKNDLVETYRTLDRIETYVRGRPVAKFARFMQTLATAESGIEGSPLAADLFLDKVNQATNQYLKSTQLAVSKYVQVR